MSPRGSGDLGTPPQPRAGWGCVGGPRTLCPAAAPGGAGGKRCRDEPGGGEGGGAGLGSGCCTGCVKTAGVFWVEKQLFCSSVEISTLGGMGIWGSAVSTRSSRPRTLLCKGKSNFFPCSPYFAIPCFLLSLLPMWFFLHFALKGRRKIQDKAGSRGVQGTVHIIKHRFFNLQKSQVFFLKLLFP